MKNICILLAILLVGIFVYGCSSATPSPTTPPPVTSAPATTAAPITTSVTTATPPAIASAGSPIKIGALLELTGGQAITGAGLKAALEYRLAQVGSQVSGRQVQLIVEDDATDPTTGLDKAKKLVQFDNVDVLLGPLFNPAGISVANYMSTTKTPNILISPKPIAVLKTGSNNIFLPDGTNGGIGYRGGLYAYDKLGYKTATVAYEDFTTGIELTGSAINGFQKQGGTIVQKQGVPSGTMDLSPYLAALKPADCAIFWFTPALAQRFVTQYYAAAQKLPLVMPGSSALSPQLMTPIGDAVTGIVGVDPYTSLIDTAANKAWVDGMSKEKNLVPSGEAACADLVLTMYLEAVKSTSGDTSPIKIIDALHKIKVSAPAGTFSFTPEGLGIGDLYVMQVVKVTGGYNWKVIDKYSQIPLDVP